MQEDAVGQGDDAIALGDEIPGLVDQPVVFLPDELERPLDAVLAGVRPGESEMLGLGDEAELDGLAEALEQRAGILAALGFVEAAHEGDVVFDGHDCSPQNPACSKTTVRS